MVPSVVSDDPSHTRSAPPFSVMSSRPSGRKATAVGPLSPVTYGWSVQPGSGVPANAGSARTAEVSRARSMRMLAPSPDRGFTARPKIEARSAPEVRRFEHEILEQGLLPQVGLDRTPPSRIPGRPHDPRARDRLGARPRVHRRREPADLQRGPGDQPAARRAGLPRARRRVVCGPRRPDRRRHDRQRRGVPGAELGEDVAYGRSRPASSSRAEAKKRRACASQRRPLRPPASGPTIAKTFTGMKRQYSTARRKSSSASSAP